MLSRDLGHGEKGDARLVMNRAKELRLKGLDVSILCLTLGTSLYVNERIEESTGSVRLVRLRISLLSALIGLVRCIWKKDSPVQSALSYSPYARSESSSFIREVRSDIVHFMTARLCGLWDQEYGRNVRKVFDLVDSYSAHYDSFLSTVKERDQSIYERLRGLIYRNEASRYRRIEDRAFGTKGSCCLLVSERDISYIRQRVGSEVDSMVCCVPIGIDGIVEKERVRGDYFLFYGNLTYWPNRQTAFRLLDRIWPRLSKDVGNAKLIVAGRDAQSDLVDKCESTERVVIQSPVEDMNLLISGAIAVISPVSMGSGMQFKVLEPMGLGVPVICDQFSAAPLNINSGVEAIVCKSDEEYVLGARELYADTVMAQGLCRSAMRLAGQYSWRATTEKLLDVYHELHEESRYGL